MKIIEVLEEVKIGEVILEPGDKIQILEDYNQFEDFTEFEGTVGEVSVTWKNMATLARVDGVLGIDRTSAPVQIPYIRNKNSLARFDLIGGKVEKFRNGFKIMKDDIIWNFFKN